jgi:hypothetical protein
MHIPVTQKATLRISWCLHRTHAMGRYSLGLSLSSS